VEANLATLSRRDRPDKDLTNRLSFLRPGLPRGYARIFVEGANFTAMDDEAIGLDANTDGLVIDISDSSDEDNMSVCDGSSFSINSDDSNNNNVCASKRITYANESGSTSQTIPSKLSSKRECFEGSDELHGSSRGKLH